MAATIPDEFLDLMAEKFRMLADPTRLAILRTLMRGECNVTRVVEEHGTPVTGTSLTVSDVLEAETWARARARELTGTKATAEARA